MAENPNTSSNASDERTWLRGFLRLPDTVTEWAVVVVVILVALVFFFLPDLDTPKSKALQIMKDNAAHSPDVNPK